MAEDLTSNIWTKQTESVVAPVTPAFDPNSSTRTEAPVLNIIGDHLELTRIPLFLQEPPKDNPPSELQKQLPNIIVSAIIGILIERTFFKRGAK